MSARFIGLAAAALLLGVAYFGYRLYNRYRAAVEYTGIGRPYPIGNSILAFAGFALMLLGVIAAGVLAMVFWTN